MNIMAIDLGKFNSMMCRYETSTQKYELETVATERGYFRSLIVNHKPDLVVVEACGPSGWVSDLCGDLLHFSVPLAVRKTEGFIWPG